MSADGPRDWVANMDRDIKARSGGHESTSRCEFHEEQDRRFRAYRELDVGSEHGYMANI